jgi:hypothetical protein
MTIEGVRADQELWSLAGSVVHDLNNLLGIINGNSELLLNRLSPADPLRGHAESIKKATEWGEALAKQILATGRLKDSSAGADLNEVVENVIRVLQPVVGDAVVVEARLDPDAGRVPLGQGQLGQVAINLVANACDAMPAGGRLVVETAHRETRPTRVGPVPPAAGWAMLRVTDTGCGIDEAARARLFQPYFTTKPGKGLGLGLNTVSQIVRQAGGEIVVASDPGRGATFTVWLPRADADGKAVPARTATAPTAAPPTVLLMEDEATIRRLIAEILTTHGYHVVEALDRIQAVALAAGHEPPVDLFIASAPRPGSPGPAPRPLRLRVSRGHRAPGLGPGAPQAVLGAPAAGGGPDGAG